MHFLGHWLEMAVGERGSEARELRFMMAVFRETDEVGVGAGGRAGLLDGSW